MKTHLLCLALCASPLSATLVSAQEEKPDAPREERKDRDERAERREQAQRERQKAEESIAATRKEIEQHLKNVRDQAAKLEADGKKDEAQALLRQAEERARNTIQERERNLRARVEAARDAAKDRVDFMTRELPQLLSPLETLEQAKDAAERRPDGPPRELQNKLGHVERAIGHLREAGLEDAAQNLSGVADRLRHAIREQTQGRRKEARVEEGRRGEPRREEGRREDRRPEGDVEALRREVQELRQAVRELNAKLSH